MAPTEIDHSDTSRRDPRDEGRWGRTLALALILGLFWYVFSGRVGLQYFIFFFCSLALVLWMNPERPFSGSDISRGAGMSGRLKTGVALLRYLGWLIWNVLKANVEVAIMILHPRLPIEPRLLRFRTTLKSDVAKVLVANSITLTPGTVTIDLEGDEYLVHAIHPRSVGAISGGNVQNAVAPIFGEAADPVPVIDWASTLEEFES